MSELYTRFDAVFFEKTRLSLVTVLYRDEKVTFNALKSRLGLSDGALYTHLEKLIGAGYAEKAKETAGLTLQTVYHLTEFGRTEFLAYLEFMREMILMERRR